MVPGLHSGSTISNCGVMLRDVTVLGAEFSLPPVLSTSWPLLWPASATPVSSCMKNLCPCHIGARYSVLGSGPSGCRVWAAMTYPVNVARTCVQVSWDNSCCCMHTCATYSRGQQKYTVLVQHRFMNEGRFFRTSANGDVLCSHLVSRPMALWRAGLAMKAVTIAFFATAKRSYS